MDNLERLLAIEEIKGVKARYFRYMDTKQWDKLGELFSVNAYFDARCAFSADLEDQSPAAQMCKDWVTEGRNEIVAFMKRGCEGFLSAHYGHGHEITVIDQQRASGVIALEDYMYLQGEEGLSQVLHGRGHYHEEYIKEGGKWRIHSSRITRLFVEFQPPSV